MKVRYPSRTSLALVLAAALIGGAGCSKGEAEASGEATAKAEVSAEAEAAVGAEAVIEEHDGGSVAWNIAPDGNVKAAVSGPDGKLIRENVNGTLEWKAGGEVKTVPLNLDAKGGLLLGAGPKLEGDLTEVNYKLTVDSKPWTGTLHLPAGGTAELVAGAKAAVAVEVPEGKLGVHGGVIQVVGKDLVEIVADEVSGEVRVYILGPDFNAVAVGDRKVTLGVSAGANVDVDVDAPQILVLTAADGDAYFKGKWGLKVDPLKLTIVVRTGAGASVALVGYRPGAKIVVGARAPRVKVRVKTEWAAHVDPGVDVDVDVHGKAKGHSKAKFEVGAPDVDVHASAGAKGKAKAGAGVDVKVDAPKPPKASAKGKASAGVSVKFN